MSTEKFPFGCESEPVFTVSPRISNSANRQQAYALCFLADYESSKIW